jgi:predicted dithiol-disulfide oxidoreductase (DUF899 family)
MEMTMTATIARVHSVVSKEEWVPARKELLAEEKAHTRWRDELTRKRMALPWVKVEQNYAFDGPDGKVTLSDLFCGRSQLMIYHFMFGPEWAEGCPSCSMAADNIDAVRVHVEQRDTALVMVSRAPIGKIEAFGQRMGWNVPWVSSNRNSFNWDYHVSFTQQELDKGEMYYNFATFKYPSTEAHGLSVFFKDERGTIFHTYSAYGRGVEGLLGTYDLLDMAPKGRDEVGLPYPMAWFRHHDRYPEAQGLQAACCHAKGEE